MTIKRWILIVCLFPISGSGQIGLIYDMNDYIPPALLRSEDLLEEGAPSKIRFFSSFGGAGINYWNDLGRSGTDSNNAFLWMNNAFYSGNFQFNLKMAYFSGLSSYGYGDSLHGRTRSVFKPRLQAGYCPSTENTTTLTILRMQLSWAPIISSDQSMVNELEFNYGGKFLVNKQKDRPMDIKVQYYFRWRPEQATFEYGVFQYFNFLDFNNNSFFRCVDFMFGYNRFSRDGFDRSDFLSVGIITELLSGSSSRIYVFTDYAKDYRSNRNLFHLGLFFQFPLLSKIFTSPAPQIDR